MLTEFIATGETVEVAFKNACNGLGISEDKAQMEVLEQAVKKTFGLFGGSPAKVRAYFVPSASQKATEYITNLFKEMGINDLQLDVKEEDNGAEIALSGEDISFIIGHRGDTLDSLQYLTSLVANQGEDNYYRISLDVGSFREKRHETLENLGKKMASKALKYGRNQKLEPMNPYERRIIHFAVQAVEGVKSWSEGEDLLRHVVIGPVAGERLNYNKPRYNNNRKPVGKNNQKDFKDRKDTRQNKPYNKDKKPVISQKAPQPFSPAPLDTTTERKKVEDAPLYGRIR